MSYKNPSPESLIPSDDRSIMVIEMQESDIIIQAYKDSVLQGCVQITPSEVMQSEGRVHMDITPGQDYVLIGRQLLGITEKLATGQYLRLGLQVSGDNDRALTLLNELGYHRTAILDNLEPTNKQRHFYGKCLD